MSKTMIYLACFMSILLLIGNAPAVTRTWDAGGDGESWDDGDNWSDNTKPGVDDTAQLDSGDEALVDSTMTETCNQIHIGYTSGAAVLDITGGSLSTTGASPYIFIGNGGTSTGTINISGGTLSGADQIFCGFGTTGTVNVTGGAVSSAEKTVVGRNAGATGTWNMSGGTLSIANHLFVGESGTGTLNITGGTITVTLDMYIGTYSGSSGTVYLDGGTINARDLYMYADRSSMDIMEGTLVLDGNDVPTVQGYIDSNYIVAYGGDPNATLNLDYNVTTAGKTTLTATPTSTSRFGYAYNGPHNAPCTIQAEDFNVGRSRMAYYAVTSGNQGNEPNYRSGVDVDIYTDSVDPSIVYIRASLLSSGGGEWVNYNFAVATAGWYDIKFRGKVGVEETGGRRALILIDDRPTYFTDAILDPCSYDDPCNFHNVNAVGPIYLTATSHTMGLMWWSRDICIDHVDISSTSAPTTLTPFTVITDTEVIVADINVLASPYNADNTGVNDCRGAIQSALNEVERRGGGTVYMPAGIYDVDGILSIGNNVTLIGDWESPLGGGSGQGTILKTTYGRNTDNYGDANNDPNCVIYSDSFIQLRGINAGVVNLSIWYPEQDLNDINEYPWTINAARNTGGYQIRNITLYNSYNGILMQRGDAATISNVYGTVLRRGLFLSDTGQYNWTYNVQFKSDFWKDADPNVITNAPTSSSAQGKLDKFITNNLEAMKFGRNAGGIVHDVTVDNAKKPIVIQKVLVRQVDANGIAYWGVDNDTMWGRLSKVNGDIIWVDAYPFDNLHVLNVDLVDETSSMSYTFGSLRKPKDANNFYNAITDYNAVADGITDDTSAIQAALNDANTAGGGTVYLPQGQYKISTHLTVPEGVELRGAGHTGQRRSKVETCTLVAYEGKDTANPGTDTALITLSQDSGIRGVTIYYPEQGFGSISSPVHTYPYTIRGNGSGVWVVDVYLPNSYNVIDFATNKCDAHLVTGMWGCALNDGIDVGGGSEGGKIERTNLTTACWFSTPRINAPHGYGQNDLNTRTIENTTGYLFGDCNDETTFGLSSYYLNIGLHFYSDGSNCRNSDFWYAGVDVAKENSSILADKGDNIDLIAPLTASDEYWLETDSGFSGTINVYDRMIRDIRGCTNHHLISGGTVNFYNEKGLLRAKDVTGTSGWNGNDDPNRAIDGLENSKWADTTTGTKWMSVDFGQPCEIRRWRLFNAGLEYSQYEKYNTRDAALEYSMDDSTYTEVDSFVNNDKLVVDRSFDYVMAKYVKLKITEATQDSNSIPDYSRIPEFEVYGSEGWHFNSGTQDWVIIKHISNMNAVEGRLELTISDTDPGIRSKDFLGIDALDYDKVIVKMMNETSSTTAQVYFKTNANPYFDANKIATVTITANDNIHRDYIFDFSDCNDWTGTIRQLRFDPTIATGDVSIEYIKLE